MVGGVQLCLNQSTYMPKTLGEHKQTLWAQGPRERTGDYSMRQNQICLWVFEDLLQRHGSAVACHGDRGSGCSRPGRQHLWIPPQSHWADNPQTEEQLYQRISWIVVKVLRLQMISHPGDLAKRLRTPREFDFEDQWDFITEFPQDWGNRLLEDTNKTLCAPGTRRKEQWPHKRLGQTSLWVSLWVSGRGMGQ